nr:nuclear egress lamina protein UL31 [Psittacid alphaherpesvirus 6]
MRFRRGLISSSRHSRHVEDPDVDTIDDDGFASAETYRPCAGRVVDTDEYEDSAFGAIGSFSQVAFSEGGGIDYPDTDPECYMKMSDDNDFWDRTSDGNGSCQSELELYETANGDQMTKRECLRRSRKSGIGAVAAAIARRRRTLSAHNRKARFLNAVAASSATNPSWMRQSCDRTAYRAYFRLIGNDPSEELAIVKDLMSPIIPTSSVTLPFDLSQAVADNCLSLSGMGYSLGIGSCCPTCTSRGDPRGGRADRASLILAYVQQVNDIYNYRAFMASVVARALHDGCQRVGDARISCDAAAFDDEDRDKPMTEAVLSKVLARPELFFAYHVLKEGGIRDARVLFYPDHEASGEYMMYVVFHGKSVHLHHMLIDRLQTACKGYRLIAHVWQTAFLLVARRDVDRQQTDTEKVPMVNAEDVYCKLRDLNIDGELLSEYAKLYVAFDDFLPPN